MSKLNSSLLGLAEQVVDTWNAADVDGAVSAIERMEEVVVEQGFSEEILLCMLAGLRDEVDKANRPELTERFEEVVSCLEDMVCIELEDRLESEVLVMNECGHLEMVPKAPPGASA